MFGVDLDGGKVTHGYLLAVETQGDGSEGEAFRTLILDHLNNLLVEESVSLEYMGTIDVYDGEDVLEEGGVLES